MIKLSEVLTEVALEESTDAPYYEIKIESVTQPVNWDCVVITWGARCTTFFDRKAEGKIELEGCWCGINLKGLRTTLHAMRMMDTPDPKNFIGIVRGLMRETWNEFHPFCQHHYMAQFDRNKLLEISTKEIPNV